MPKAYILNEHLDQADRVAVEAAIRAAGYEPDYAVPSDLSPLNPNTDIGVVGLPVVSGDEAAVSASMQAFAGAGIRVVCIWLHDEDVDGVGVPDGVDKYGTTVDIGSDELTGTLKGETDVWEKLGGGSRPAPVTKRNKC